MVRIKLKNVSLGCVYLAHEPLDDAVEVSALEMQGLARRPLSFLARAQAAEILNCL